MSFILDALKKSERERERQQQPALLELPQGRRSRAQPIWMLAVVGLLLVNCVLLLVMWWRSSHTPAPVIDADTLAVVSSSTASNTPRINATPRAAEVRPLQDEAGAVPEAADETAAALADVTPVGSPLVRATDLAAAAMAQQDNAVRLKANRGNPVVSNAEGVPTLQSLGGNEALSLPELRLDVHVYSSVASERFAFINSRKYTEGQNLNEGPHVDRISQDGVILSYRNQRFLLPRQ